MVSGSSQVTYSGLTGIPAGIVSGSSQVSFNGITDKPTLVSGSAQITYSGLTGIPSGIVSGSAQVTYSGLTGIPSGIVSGSSQVAALGFATTGSNGFNGSQSITGSLTVTGQVVAQTLNVQQVTSSIVYSSGSNVFGNSLSNTQQFTGSVGVTGSLTVSGTGTFSNSIYGTNALFGSSFLSNETSKIGIGFESGYGLVNSWGANTSTYGGLKLQISVSNGATFNALTIAPSGFVGIGTNASLPYGRLEVADVSRLTNAGQWASATISMKQVGGFIGDYSQIVFGYHSNTQTNSSAYIGYVATNQGSNGYGDLVFGTRAVNTDTQPTERMRITSDGDLILGRTNYDPKFYMTSTGGNGINERFYIDGYAHGGGSGYGGGFRLYTRDTVNVFQQRLTIDSGGAATFSSSVAATQLNISNVGGKFTGEGGATNYLGIYKDDGTYIFRVISNGSGVATFLSDDGSGNRTTVNDVLTITQTNPNAPYSGFGSGILFRGTTYNGGGSGSPGVRNWGRIVMQLTDSSISTTGENMVFQVASADNSDTLTTALTLAYNGAATFNSTTFSIAKFNSTYGQVNIDFQNSGTTFASIGSGVSVTSTAAADDTGIGTAGLNKNIVFATGTSYLERMRITSGGQVLFGTTSGTGITTGTSANQGVGIGGGVLEIQTNNNSNIYLSKATGYTSGDFTAHFVNGSYVGGISTNGSATNYATASDYRLKQDLKDFDGITLINKIKTYDYEWKVDNTRMFGVIAHELQEILPFAVTGEKDAERMQGVDYSKLIPVLVKAIQELKAENDTLKSRIDTLEQA